MEIERGRSVDRGGSDMGRKESEMEDKANCGKGGGEETEGEDRARRIMGKWWGWDEERGDIMSMEERGGEKERRERKGEEQERVGEKDGGFIEKGV